MSNIFKGTYCPYFQVPQGLVKYGTLAQMDACELKLYVALLFEAQRRSRTSFIYKNEELRGLTGLSESSLSKARTQLCEKQLLECNRGLGGVYEFTVCIAENEDVLNELAVNPDQSEPKVRRRRPVSSLSREQCERYFKTRLLSACFIPGGLQALCPFHEDTKPSLFVKFDGCCWYCHGCKEGGTILKFEKKLSGTLDTKAALVELEQIAGASGLVSDEIEDAEAIYQYQDALGRVTHQLVRLPGKRFFQRQWRGDRWAKNTKGLPRLLYRLPEVLRASHVIVCEGEKDVDRLASIDWQNLSGTSVTATTSPNGAGNWRKEFGDYLMGKSVVILPDMDEAGLRHAEKIQESLDGSVKLVEFPAGFKDASDYLDSHSESELVDLIGRDWFVQEKVIPVSEFVEV